MIRFALLISLLTILVGCTSEDPHPEEKDPIYKDLKARSDAHLKSIEEGNKRLAELRESLEKAEPNSIELKDIRRDLAKTQIKVRESEKWSKYFKIRADRRAVMDKIAAREAASTDKPWPDPREYSDYLMNKRLTEVPLNWNARVPKLQDRLSKPAGKKGKGGEGEAEAAAAPAGH